MISRTIPLLAAVILLAAPAVAAPVKKPVAPVTAESLRSQARAAISRGETELALRLAQSAIVANPASTHSYVVLGDIYADIDQPDYARNFYESALVIEPTDAAALKAIQALDGKSSSTTAKAGP